MTPYGQLPLSRCRCIDQPTLQVWCHDSASLQRYSLDRSCLRHIKFSMCSYLYLFYGVLIIGVWVLRPIYNIVHNPILAHLRLGIKFCKFLFQPSLETFLSIVTAYQVVNPLCVDGSTTQSIYCLFHPTQRGFWKSIVHWLLAGFFKLLPFAVTPSLSWNGLTAQNNLLFGLVCNVFNMPLLVVKMSSAHGYAVFWRSTCGCLRL